MKKLLLLACLVVALVPRAVKAEDHDWDDRPKHHIRATEVAGVGLGVAALVGIAGYFLLRRRNSA